MMLGGQLGMKLEDGQGERKGIGSNPVLCSSWSYFKLDAWYEILFDQVYVAVSGTAKHLAVPAARGTVGMCVRFAPRAADLLFVRREPFIWQALASAASFHARCSEIKGCFFPRPLLNALELVELDS